MKREYWKDIERGDTAAYSAMYVFYYGKLFNYGRKFTDNGDLIEDVIQDAFIMIWNNRTRLPAIKSPQSYLFFSFRNGLFKKLKESRKTLLQGDAEAVGGLTFLEPVVVHEDDPAVKRRLEKGMKQLTYRQREAVFLRFYEGLSYEEVATVMNISVKAAYKIMARALLHLKETLTIPVILTIPLLLLPLFVKQLLLLVLPDPGFPPYF